MALAKVLPIPRRKRRVPGQWQDLHLLGEFDEDQDERNVVGSFFHTQRKIYIISPSSKGEVSNITLLKQTQVT